MNRTYELLLKVLRRYVYPRIGTSVSLPPLEYLDNLSECQRVISDAMMCDKPFMVGRLGSTEMNTIANYIGVRDNPHSVIKYIKGEITEWWWNMTSINQMQSNAGFFPISEENIIKYSKLMLEDVQQVDVLGSWVPQEVFIQEELKSAKKYALNNILPPILKSDSPDSWTYSLKGKKVLVVHPFQETIENQYKKREKLFMNPDFLPQFELKTLKAIQSIGGESSFSDWFSALEWMKKWGEPPNYYLVLEGIDGILSHNMQGCLMSIG